MITALFDGHCVICQTIRRMIKAIDCFNRVEFVDLHDKALVEDRYPQYRTISSNEKPSQRFLDGFL